MIRRVSCIIPAYNEAPRIRNVLKSAVGHPLISEIIVIDDCSKDDTAAIAASFAGVRVIRHEVNAGKTKGMCEGIVAAREELLLFLDADLVGLTREHLTALIAPVARAEADVSLSLRDYHFWVWLGVDPLSGERVAPRQLCMESLPEIEALPRFGFESFLNRLMITKRLRVRIVRWSGVVSPYKSKKHGWWRGIRADIVMLHNIFTVISLREALQQVIILRRLARSQ